MANVVDDLTGKTFERLVVIRFYGKNRFGNILWFCKCECGGTTITTSSSLKTGHTKSCGCLQKQRVKEVHKKHGHSPFNDNSPEYRAWVAMKARCFNKKLKGYPDYGGRGITVSPEWVNDFSAFFSHIGERPSPRHSVDRWPNNNGNYEPGNVRWAIPKQQVDNRRNNVWVVFNGERMVRADFKKLIGVKSSTVNTLLKTKSTKEVYEIYKNKKNAV